MPWLGDLPYLGYLFKTRTLTTAKTELLVFLTPKSSPTARPRAERALTPTKIEWDAFMKSLIWALAALVTSRACRRLRRRRRTPARRRSVNGGCSGAASSASCVTSRERDRRDREHGPGRQRRRHGDDFRRRQGFRQRRPWPVRRSRFSANTGNITGASAVTNASGVATATFAAGANRANRTATVTVNSGTANGHVVLDIVGTVLSLLRCHDRAPERRGDTCRSRRSTRAAADRRRCRSR